MQMVMQLLLVISLLFLPVKAGEVLTLKGKPLRFEKSVIKLRIDPKIRHRKVIAQYLIATINNNSNVTLAFDGFKKPYPYYNGIYIQRKNLPAYGYTDHVLNEQVDYMRIELGNVYLTKWSLIDKFDYYNDENEEKMLIIALHETLHALGIAHNNDQGDVMYPGYNPGRQWKEHSIKTLNDLYD